MLFTGQIEMRFAGQIHAITHLKTPSFFYFSWRLRTNQSVYFLGVGSEETQPGFVERQAIFNYGDMQSLETLNQQLQELLIKSPDELRRKLSEQRNYLKMLSQKFSSLQDGLDNNVIEEMQKLNSQIATLEEALKVASAEQFSNASVTGVGTDAWRELFIAAQKYAETVAYPNLSFPASDTDCVLCHQKLSEEAYSRLETFKSFISSETESKKLAAERDLDLRIKRIQSLDFDMPSYEQSLAAIFSESEMDSLRLFLRECNNRAEKILLALIEDNWDTIAAIPVVPECLKSVESSLQSQWDSISDIDSNAEAIETVKSQISELKSKKLLKENLPVVLKHLKDIETKSKYRKAADSIRTTRISNKAKSMQSKYVSEHFNSLLRNELIAAGVSQAIPSVTERTEKGKVTRTLAVGSKMKVSPVNVFSEGERTAIGLACFMAELGTEDDTSGIIFDDPVTSLDHQIRESIAQRLVKESKTRQVIVFTHDLVFFRELLSSAVKEEVTASVQCVNRLGEHTGIITDRPPWDAAGVKDRLNQLEPLLDKAEQAVGNTDLDGYKEALEIFYKRLRETWERVVEEHMFNGVVSRLERPVYTQKLIAAIVDDETVETVFDAMSTASSRLHDNAAAAGTAQVTVTTAKDDLNVLKAFIKDILNKKKAVEDRRKHLKGKLK